MGFPTKNDNFGVFWGHHHLRKHPCISIFNIKPCLHATCYLEYLPEKHHRAPNVSVGGDVEERPFLKDLLTEEQLEKLDFLRRVHLAAAYRDDILIFSSTPEMSNEKGPLVVKGI